MIWEPTYEYIFRLYGHGGIPPKEGSNHGCGFDPVRWKVQGINHTLIIIRCQAWNVCLERGGLFDVLLDTLRFGTVSLCIVQIRDIINGRSTDRSRRVQIFSSPSGYRRGLKRSFVRKLGFTNSQLGRRNALFNGANQEKHRRPVRLRGFQHAHLPSSMR